MRPAGENGGTACVSVGRAIPGHEIAIVDPERRVVVDDGLVGEIWLRGPSVADGYWRPSPEHEVFDATLEQGETRTSGWLRTGDLGFLEEGRLYVTGRRKNVIIVNGRNLAAEDLELVAEAADPRLVAVAAFALEVDGQERIALVAEVSDGDAALQAVAEALRASVRDGFQAPVAWVGLTKPRRLPRTTSGKLRRQAIRRLLLDGELVVTASFDHLGAPAPPEEVLA
ncbi:MAG: AMP-binding protein [Sandaracinaceae bacterium]|nr:AMP-binding protein [Sandaracinaceae bacterium]